MSRYEQGTLGRALGLAYRSPDGKASTLEELVEEARRLLSEGSTTGERFDWLERYNIIRTGRSDATD